MCRYYFTPKLNGKTTKHFLNNAAPELAARYRLVLKPWLRRFAD
jgi:hypothetical protein